MDDIYQKNRRLFHTYTNTCRNRGQGNPEGDPGEDNQQAGGDIRLQDEVQNAPLQLEVEDQLWVVTFVRKGWKSVSVVVDDRKHG